MVRWSRAIAAMLAQACTATGWHSPRLSDTNWEMAEKLGNRALSKRLGSGGRVVLGVGLVLACLAAGGVAAGGAAAIDPPIKPYKDDLFQNVIVRSFYNGDMRFIEYSKKRDLYGRDQVVEKKAFGKFVDLAPDDTQHDFVLAGRGVRYIGVGRTEGDARFVVIFLHGGGDGSRHQAVDDWSFGGNFNRLKNLVTRNDGVYLSPDFSNFGDGGRDDIKTLMQTYAAKSPGAPIIVACTSLSGWLCFDLMANDEAAKLLGGIVLLGSLPEQQFFTSPIFTDPDRHIPIFIGHGTRDPILDWVTQELFFKKIRAAAPDYPVRLDVFLNGLHGTPMRLTDWRRVLNWMIEEDGGPAPAGKGASQQSVVPIPRDRPSP